jgi:hypothetical protein
LETELNLDPDSNPDTESDPELITDPDPNLQIVSDPAGSGCTTLLQSYNLSLCPIPCVVDPKLFLDPDQALKVHMHEILWFVFHNFLASFNNRQGQRPEFQQFW